MNENDFNLKQKEAVERMKEMNSRAVNYENSNQYMPPVPPFVKVPGNNRYYERNPDYKENNVNTEPEKKKEAPDPVFNTEKKEQPNQNDSKSFFSSLLGGLDLPFTDLFKKDADISIILGLLLILLSEKADKKLLFALVYILL